MNEMQHAKYVVAIAPAVLLDNTSATVSVIDTRGFDYMTIVIQLGATDIAVTALKLTNSATSGGSYADVTGATFNAGTGAYGATLALPSATDDNQTLVFQVDLKGRDPFYKLVATFGDGTVGGYIAAAAVLTRKSGGATASTSTAMADGDVCRV